MNKVRGAIRLVLVACVATAPSPLVAQATESIARIVVIEPKEGMRRQFEEGYRRHLQWHADSQDPWTWYGWTILTGTRNGLFMDGTFGHRWEDLDAAVDPGGDARDNALNVSPYGTFVYVSHYELLATLSTTQRLEHGKPSAFLGLVYHRVRPGREADFERVLKTIREAQGEAEPAVGYTWYRRVEGGELPAYLLMLPLENFTDFRSAGFRLARLIDELFPDDIAETLRDTVEQSVVEVHSETIRFRRDMSYFPTE